MDVEYRREVRAIARNGRLMSSAEFFERALQIHLQPWQRQICDWIDTPAPKQG